MRKKNIVVIGAGLSGLASAALLARAGHDVTVLEGSAWVGGKSRRIEIQGNRMDTGPALVTFPGVWHEFLSRYDELGEGRAAQEIAGIEFETLEEVGDYFYRDTRTLLPVRADHLWHNSWQKFESEHAGAAKAITTLLTSSTYSPKAISAVGKLASLYGPRLTTRSYLAGQQYLPQELREIIAIHTLNAGVGPERTLALFATMAAVMAKEGILVPKGGVAEIPEALRKLAEAAGAKILLNKKVSKIRKGQVLVGDEGFPADLVVSSLDAAITNRLLGSKQKNSDRAMSCSGIAIYAVLKQELIGYKTHSVIMPDDPAQLHSALAKKELPNQSMVFVNYYRAGHIYPNEKPTVAVLITAPADGKNYSIDHPFVQSELARVSQKMGLGENIQNLFDQFQILDPRYFATWGAAGGALYGEARRIWQSGPLHKPAHRSIFRPWLIRVGASTHPGGGIPAVIGGALIATKSITKINQG